MTISQGESPRGTCPGDLSSVNRPKPVIPQWFPPKLVDQSRPRVRCSTSGRPTHSLMFQCPGSGVVVAHNGR